LKLNNSFNHYGRKYKGLLEEYNGKKLGANVIMFDAEHLNEFIRIFKKFKVSAQIIKVFEQE